MGYRIADRALKPKPQDRRTIRFARSEPVPVKLIERLAKFRAKEVAEGEAKAAAAKTRSGARHRHP